MQKLNNSQMNKKLLKAHISPSEIEQFVNCLIPPEGGTTKTPLTSNSDNFKFDGDLTIDFRDASAKYQLGSLTYGPVDVALYVKKLSFKIDWHKDLNIPHEVCIDIKDPCGHQLIHQCIHFDLGVTEIIFIQDQTFRWREKGTLLDIAFRDNGGDYYALTGDLPIAEILTRAIGGIIRGAVKQLGEDLVNKLLEHVLGTGDIAKLFILAIKAVFHIVDVLLGWLFDLIAILERPFDELLHKVFGNLLEIVLQEKAFPKKLPVISEDKLKARPAVTIDISTAPFLTLAQSGLELEVYK